MRALLTFLNIWNFIVVVSLVIYFPLVYLRLTFTHDNLPDDNVPFYIHADAGDLTEVHSGRYEMYWWIYATDALRILVPVFVIINVGILKYYGIGLTVFFQVIVSILTIWELVKFIWAIILWVPDNCVKHQFCRNFGSRRDELLPDPEIGDDPSSQNYVYTVLTFYSLGFFIVMIFYLVFLGNMDGSLFKYLRRKEFMEEKKPQKIKSRERRNAQITMIFNFFVAIALVVYFALVYLNFTFTSGKMTSAAVPMALKYNLPDDNVPHFIHDVPTDPTELNSENWGLYWWLYATDALLIFMPVLMVSNVVTRSFDGSGFTVFLQWILAFFTIWQLVKFVWAAVLSLPSLCAAHQFCRSFKSRRDGFGNEIGEPPGNINYVYASYVWFNLGWCIVMLINLILVSSLPGAMLNKWLYRVSPLREPSPEPPPPPQTQTKRNKISSRKKRRAHH